MRHRGNTSLGLGFASAVAALAAALALVLSAGGTATAQLGGNVPTGTVVPYAGASAPSGWLLANGLPVSRTVYADLFTAIGITYGAGDGATTFNLPDLQGRVAVGRGTNAEVDALNDNDGLSASSRKVSHRHGKGSLAIGSSGGHFHTPANGLDFVTSHVGATQRDDGPGALRNPTPGTYRTSIDEHTHPNSSFSGEVGDTTGPLDRSGFITLNYIIKT